MEDETASRFNVGLEQQILGWAMLQPKIRQKVPYLKPQHFADPVHEEMWSILQRHQENNAVTFKSESVDSRFLEESGGIAYIEELLSTAAPWVFYLRTMAIREMADSLISLWRERQVP